MRIEEERIKLAHDFTAVKVWNEEWHTYTYTVRPPHLWFSIALTDKEVPDHEEDYLRYATESIAREMIRIGKEVLDA